MILGEIYLMVLLKPEITLSTIIQSQQQELKLSLLFPTSPDLPVAGTMTPPTPNTGGARKHEREKTRNSWDIQGGNWGQSACINAQSTYRTLFFSVSPFK